MVGVNKFKIMEKITHLQKKQLRFVEKKKDKKQKHINQRK